MVEANTPLSGISVLLVDDDWLVLQATLGILEDLGAEVFWALTGRAALELLNTEASISVLVTDLQMPGMDGLELARQACLLRKNIKIVLVSGFAEMNGMSEHPILWKPYSAEQLREAILEARRHEILSISAGVPATGHDFKGLRSERLVETAKELTAADKCALITDPRLPDNPIVYSTRGFLRHTGYELREVLGRNCRFLQGPGTDAEIRRALREAISSAQRIRVRILNYRKEGTPFLNEISIRPFFQVDGSVEAFMSVQQPATAAGGHSQCVIDDWE